MKITIFGEFPTLNEVIKASKSHYMAYANQKKDYTALASIYIKDMPKISGKNDWIFHWYRKDRRNDPDNIQIGTKYILDSFVKNGIIKNDGWNEINSISHHFHVDKENPRVEIQIRGGDSVD